MFPEVFKFIRQQDVPADDNAKSHDRDERRKDPANAVSVELDKGKTTLGQAAKDYRGDQKAGYYEEHVDADKTPGNPFWKCVVTNDCQNRNGPESVNVGPIFRARVLFLGRTRFKFQRVGRGYREPRSG